MSRSTVIGAALGLLLQVSIASAQSIVGSPVLQDRAPAVVRLDLRGADGKYRVASGFVWSKPNLVVTAYHAVASAQSIGVAYTQRPGGGYVYAKVVKVAPVYDLALLELDDPPHVQPLTLIPTEKLTPGQELVVVGHPLGSTKLQAHTLKQRVVAPAELSGLVGEEDKSQLKALGAEYLEQLVIAVEGGLLPGYSGAPVFDPAGVVVGIGNGGLKGGVADWGWLIPAWRLRDDKRFGQFDEAARKLVVPLHLLFGADAQLPEYEIKPTLTKASAGLVIDARRSAFAGYLARINTLHEDHRRGRTFQQMTDGFEPLADTSIFTIKRGATVGFQIADRSAGNSEYLAYAALTTLSFHVACYSATELEKRLSDAPSWPDVAFSLKSDLFHDPSNFTDARLFHSDQQIALVIRDFPIGRHLNVKAGFLNGALLFGGGCEISPRFDLPRDAPAEVRVELQDLIEQSVKELNIDFGSGVEVKLKPAAVAHIGRLRDDRTILLASFPKFPGEKERKK